MRDARRRTAAELADEADNHRDDPIAKIDHRAYIVRRKEIESRKHGEMTVQFRIGSQRDLETAEELWCGAQRVTLCNVGGDGKGRATNLIGEGKVSAQLRTQGQQICLVGELLGSAPGVETLELPHVREPMLGGRRRGNPIPAWRYGFHASRIKIGRAS